MQVFVGIGFEVISNLRREGEEMSQKTPVYYLKNFSSAVEMLEALKEKVAEMKKSLQSMWNIDSVETQIEENEAYAIIHLSQK